MKCLNVLLLFSVCLPLNISKKNALVEKCVDFVYINMGDIYFKTDNWTIIQDI